MKKLNVIFFVFVISFCVASYSCSTKYNPSELSLAAPTIFISATATKISDIISTATVTPPAGMTLVWSDEFNGTTINRENWNYDIGGSGWGNNELEYYTSRTVNAYVESGKLVIQALAENYGGMSYTSARLKSENLVYKTYGRIEASIKLPIGQGIWPAFWMLGNNIGTVGWPACGEVDILEMIGGGSGRDNKYYGTAHWNDSGHQFQGGNGLVTWPATLSDSYHTYAIEWTATQIKWYFDNNLYYTIDTSDIVMNELRLPTFIVLNLAVGGSWPGNPDGTTTFPQKMFVDWVRWYQ
ncbi:MAG: glycoside hydrolase family 16 protein [bacterium]